jgi:hypothetical protein
MTAAAELAGEFFAACVTTLGRMAALCARGRVV